MNPFRIFSPEQPQSELRSAAVEMRFFILRNIGYIETAEPSVLEDTTAVSAPVVEQASDAARLATATDIAEARARKQGALVTENMPDVATAAGVDADNEQAARVLESQRMIAAAYDDQPAVEPERTLDEAA